MTNNSQNLGGTEPKKKGQNLPHAWKPGQSGNPGGRSRIVAECEKIAQGYMPAIIKAMAEVALNPKYAAAGRVSAAQFVAERGLGKVANTINLKQGISDQDRALLQASFREAVELAAMLPGKRPSGPRVIDAEVTVLPPYPDQSVNVLPVILDESILDGL